MIHASDSDRSWLARIRERKHLALLVLIVVLQTMHPLLVHLSEHTRVLADVVILLMVICVFLAVFERRWERRLAVLLAVPGVLGNIGFYVLPERLHTAAAILYHASGAVFFGFAVFVILGGVFRHRTVRVDSIIGAACGYLLAATAWGSLYAMVYLVSPGSFRVAQEIAWQLNDWHTRHALFNYFSMVSLTGLGYGDITPMSPPVYALVSLEVVFGLFYLAVVVAQLVGLMIISRDDGERSP